MILCGNDPAEISCVKLKLDDLFKIKDLGPLKIFLGLEVAHCSKGISLCQRKYTLELLESAGLLACKPAATPMVHSQKLVRDDGDPLDDVGAYRRLIGQLLYLTNSRPNICYAVTHLSQFLSKPMKSHYQAALHVLKYLKGSPGRGLFFSSESDIQLKAFSDACPDSRRSITGYCVFLGNSLDSWKSKKQPTVSRSSPEAEYRALAATTCEVQWLTYLLHNFHINFTSPAVLYCDSKSALHLAANLVFHERTKHIELDCHIVREKVGEGLIHLLPIRSQSQLADLCTKALPPKVFLHLTPKLGMLDIHAPA